MNYSQRAIDELRLALIEVCGADKVQEMSDNEINEIADLLLNSLSECLKK